MDNVVLIFQSFRSEDVDGKPLTFNVDFAHQVLFLSQQLDCSEIYVAGLLHSVMTENPNIGSVECIEATVAEFH